MTENANVPRVRISSPDEMTQVIPYLVGFTPEKSLVIVVLDQGSVAVTARVDIADIQAPGEAEHLLDRIWARFPDADAHLAAYTADQPAGWELLNRCADHLGPEVAQQSMVIDADTWHLPDGTHGPADRFGPVAAEASFHGLQRLPSRSELAATFTGPPDSPELTNHITAALNDLPAPDDTEAIVARTAELLRTHLPAFTTDGPDGTRASSATLDVQDAIQLSVLVQNSAARELALLSITRENARDHLAFWRAAINQIPDYGAEAPLFMAGMAAWASGEGAMASIALERTDQVGEPGPYPPARLLDELIDRVVPPAAWDGIRTDALKHAAPIVRETLTPAPAEHVWETVTPSELHPRRQGPDLEPPTAPRIAI